MKRAVGLTMATVGFVACAGTTQPRATVAERPVDVPAVPSADKPAEPPPPCSDAATGLRAFSADGSALAVARGTAAVVVDTKDFKERSEVDVGVPIRRLALSPDGKYLIVIGSHEPLGRGPLLLARTRDGNVLLEREHLVSPMPQHEKAVFSPDARWLALAVPDAPQDPDSDDNVAEHVEILELSGLTRYGSITQPTTVTNLPHPKWQPRKLAPRRRPPPRGASGLMGPPMLANAGRPTPNSPPDWSEDELEPDRQGVVDLVPSPSALLIVWASGSASVVDARAGKLLATLLFPFIGAPSRLTLSPSGRFTVVPRASGAVAIYDLDQQQGRLFYDPLCPSSSAAPSFSHAEDVAVLSGHSFSACVVDLTSGKLQTLLPPKPPAHGPYEDEGIRAGGPWSPDDRSVVVQDMAGQATVWDLAAKTTTPVERDGLTARSTQTRRDGSLVFFDELGKPMAELVGSKLSYLPVTHPDGMASAVSPDAELVLWGFAPPLTLLSARDGKPKASLKDPPKSGIYGFDPSSRYVYTTDEALFVWRADSGAMAYKDPPRCK